MTPAKTNIRGASTGLVLLAFSVLALLSSPIAARASGPAFTSGPTNPQLEIGVPKSHPVARRHVPVTVTCLPGLEDSSPCRGRLSISYTDHRGRGIKVPPFARAAVNPPWIAPGVAETYRGRVARNAAVRKALRKGPVKMKILVQVRTQLGSEVAGSATVRLTG